MTGALYQPFAFAGGETPTIVGAVVSMLNVSFADAVFPALSTAVPLRDCPAPSVAAVCGAVHEAIPDRASEQVNVTVTFVLFHPALFATGDCAAVITGAVRSILTVAVFTASTLPATSVLQKAPCERPHR